MRLWLQVITSILLGASKFSTAMPSPMKVVGRLGDPFRHYGETVHDAGKSAEGEQEERQGGFVSLFVRNLRVVQK